MIAFSHCHHTGGYRTAHLAPHTNAATFRACIALASYET